MSHALRELARSRFIGAHDRSPDAIAFAPGRVNLIGEHVDYAEGIVLPMAIERGTAVAAAPTPAGSRSRLCAEHFEIATVDLDQWIAEADRTRSSGDWTNYPLGVIAMLRESGLDVPPLDLAIASDLPIGGGLSSSAALTVATALAAMAIAGVDPDRSGRLRLARLCREVEHRFAGVPCGLMDPTVVALAREDHALRLDCQDESIRQVLLPESAAIVVFDSGVRHRLDEGGYTARQQDVHEAATMLGVPSLRALFNAVDGSVSHALSRLAALPCSARARRRATHVLTEIDRVRRFEEALVTIGDDPAGANRSLAELGRVLLDSHASLRDDFAVSTPELDAIVSFAVDAGAFGARLTGAGFGGCAIALTRPEHADATGSAVASTVADRFGTSCDWFRTRPARGAAVFFS